LLGLPAAEITDQKSKYLAVVRLSRLSSSPGTRPKLSGPLNPQMSPQRSLMDNGTIPVDVGRARYE